MTICNDAAHLAGLRRSLARYSLNFHTLYKQLWSAIGSDVGVGFAELILGSSAINGDTNSHMFFSNETIPSVVPEEVRMDQVSLEKNIWQNHDGCQAQT